MMRNIAPLSASMLFALASCIHGAQAGDSDRCGGVLMSSKTVGLKDHKALVEKLGFWMIDGGFVKNGESTCTSVSH